MTRRTLAPIAALCALGATPAPGERSALEQEPYADAPGTTPVGEPLRPKADSPDQDIELSGYLRTRHDLGLGWDLNRGPTEGGSPLWPARYTDGGRSTLITSADLRLRTDVDARVGYGVSLRLSLDVLDAVHGSSPDGPFAGGVTSQRPPDSSIQVRQAYGSVVLPFGVLSAGRMGPLIDWGAGLLFDAADDLDDDVSDVGDRVALTTPLAGLLWTAAYELAASGPTTAAGRPDLAPAFDLDPDDDVRTISFVVARWDGQRTRRRRREAGRPTFNLGVLASRRWQRFDLVGSEPSPANAVARDLDAWLVDGWTRVDVGDVTFELEGAVLEMAIGDASVLPGVELTAPITGLQWGGLARLQVRTPPRLHLELEVGVASGDDAPGFGARRVSGPPAVAGDLDGAQVDLGRSPPDTTVNNLRFHPNHHVDLILWRRLIGTVTDAFYGRQMVRWRVGPMLSVEAAVIGSSALKPNSTPSGEAALGVEADLGVIYEQEHGFVARLDYGLLFPLGGLRNVVLDLDPDPAHALHLLLAFRY